MCDTVVVIGSAAADGKILLAKNSDRDPNEAHELIIVPAADYAEGSSLQCTYISIPQVRHTYRMFLARPFWIWGAEMGVNEHGVAIGNEAVFTKEPREKSVGLIGMDLLRLALERADNALAAIEVIVKLLETYGQGGNCGFSHSFFYDNSFLIADRQQAWVLETAGRRWAAEKVESVRSISNALTIGGRWDMASADLVEHALERGWCKSTKNFDFASCYSEPIYTRAGAGLARQACTMRLLQKNKGKLTPQSLFGLLRSHEVRKGIGAQANLNPSDGEAGWTPDRAISGAQVCMHTGWGPIRESQSVGSMVARLDESLEIWATGTSAPCTSIFKPIWLDAGLPALGASPQGTYDEKSLWWRHEMLHREVLLDYRPRLAAYVDQRDGLENEFVARAEALRGSGVSERRKFTAECFEKADQALAQWLQSVCAIAPKHAPRFYYRAAWKNINRRGKMKIK